MTHPYIQKLENTRYGFFVKNYRLSLLIVILLIVYGSFAAYQIPKESSPDIKFGIVSITTTYPGANPLDIDSIITEKIEKEIKDLEGIDTYSSSSAVGFSNTTITLKNDVDVNTFIDEVKQKVDKINFPTDVNTPIVTELSTRNEVLFQMMLYAPKKEYSMNHLRSLAFEFAHQIEGKGGIVDVKVDGNIGSSELSAGSAGTANNYNLSVLLIQEKVEDLGLTINSIVQNIKAFNQNLPLGNHELGDLNYDYRISGEKKDIAQLLDIPIQLPKGEYIKLGDIARIERLYANKNISYGGIKDSTDNHAVSLVIYKANRINIFNTAGSAKKLIEETLEKPIFGGIKAAYTQDLSDIIVDDYKNLGSNGLQAIVLIFLVTRFFIGFKQSLIATLSMPIAFFITFIYLNANGSTLNFMTNFSLVLSFGMGIDTVIVIIEASYEYMKKGFTPKAAVLIAMKNYAFPNISSSLCNMIVFLPMMLLPGVLGKFLSFIPITIFVTLLGSTILASTLNSALFFKINKNLPYYYHDDDKEGTFTEIEHEVLDEMRIGKEVRGRETQPRSDRLIQSIADNYVRGLKWTMETKFKRRTTFLLPIFLLILSFIFLAPSIGFKLFPSGDNPSILIDVLAKQGMTTEAMTKYAEGIDVIFANIPELKSYQINIIPAALDITVLLVKQSDRTRNSFEIQEEIMNKIIYLREQGLKVESKVQAGGPPSGKAIGVKLTADNPDKLNELKRISLDFENFLKNTAGTININNSSTTNPGQFAFSFDDNKLAELGLTPSDVQFELYSAINGSKAGTITLDKEDRDIIVKYDSLENEISPEKILDTPITTRQGSVKLGTIASYNINQALSTIRRVDGDMTITVEADVEQGVAPTSIQPTFEAFAESYQYPDGLGFKKAGENEANKELIQATFSALGLALFLVFAILVFEFNSFGKPLIILYSILTALLGANIGMYVTGNPYSMPFMIGFISLIGIVVNMAIFLVDRMNENINRGLTIERAIIEAATTRFKAVVISSITTIGGIIGLAFQDEFWAGLGFTVVFGLIFCAFITLFALPNIFYASYGNKTKVVG